MTRASPATSPHPRRARRVLFLFVLGLAGLVAGAWMARLSIAESLAVAALRARGVERADLRFARLGLTGARITSVRLGADGAFRADEITAVYTLGGLMEGRLAGLSATGVRLRARADATGLSFGPLDALVKGGGATPAKAYVFPPARVRDAEIAVRTPLGEARLAGSLDLEPAEDGGARARADVRVEAPVGRLAGRVRATLDPEGAVGGTLTVTEGSALWTAAKAQGLTGRLTFAAGPGMTRPQVRGRLRAAALEVGGLRFRAPEVSLDVDEHVASFSARLPAGDGRGRLDVTAEADIGRAPAVLRLDVTATGAGEAILAQAIAAPPVRGTEGRLSLTVAGTPSSFAGTLTAALAAREARVGDIALSRPALDLNATLAWRNRILTLAGPRAGRLRTQTLGLGPGTRIEKDLTLPLRAGVGPLLAIDLRAPGRPRWRYDLRLGQTAFRVVQGPSRLVAEGLSPDIRVQGDGPAADGRHSLTITARGGGLRMPDHELRLTDMGARAEVMVDTRSSPRLSFEATVDPARFRATVGGERRLVLSGRTPAATVRGTGAPGRGTYRVRIDAHGGTLSLAHSLRMGGIGASLDLALPLAADGPLGTVRIASLEAAARPAPVVPLGLSGRLARAGGAVTFRGRLADARSRLVMAISGAYDADKDTGDVRATLPPLRFAPDGLQPTDLFPVARPVVADADGTLALHASAAWRKGRVEAALSAPVKAASVIVSGIPVTGLEGVLRYALGPGRPSLSAFTVGAVDLGVPLTDGSLRFRLFQDLRLLVEESAWSLAGGRLFVRDTVVDPRARDLNFVVQAEGIDVSRLVALAGTQGLVATGTFNGRIPVTVSNGRLAIRGGSIANAAPGTIRYPYTGSLEDLRRRRPEIALFVQALENFHYDRADVTLDRDAAGDLSVTLHLLGRNPEVMNGRPFDFNMNISGDLAEVARCFVKGLCSADEIGQMLLQFTR